MAEFPVTVSSSSVGYMAELLSVTPSFPRSALVGGSGQGGCSDVGRRKRLGKAQQGEKPVKVCGEGGRDSPWVLWAALPAQEVEASWRTRAGVLKVWLSKARSPIGEKNPKLSCGVLA